MKHYSLQRKSYVNAITNNFSVTLKSFGGFVGCLVGSGITWGIIRNMDLSGKLSATDELRLAPGIFLVCAVFFAKHMYNDFKYERERFHQLALEIDKERERRKLERQKAMSGFVTPDQSFNLEIQKLFDKGEKIVELKKYQDILNNGEIQEESGISQDKRKSLNNGIFKSNDTY